MDPLFITGLVLAFLVVWTLGAFFYWRINQATKAGAAHQQHQPALKLAEQWIADSQKKMEVLIQKAEQPLSLAQNELLELRLEASRLPQGVKNLKLVRESLMGPLRPAVHSRTLAEITRLYLEEGEFREVQPSLVCWKTSLGERFCLEIEGTDDSFAEPHMKNLLSLVSQSAPLAEGGFLYFKREKNYLACLANPEWERGLKSRGLILMDLKGLTALLVSLRLAGDVEKVLQTFDEGVASTLGLTGQSEKMNEALSRLGAHSLKSRTALEGTPPMDLREKP